MAFSEQVAEDLLVRSGRRCCLCRQFKGTKVEVHHIVQAADGGTDDADNGIPLCFDCHAEVMNYNSAHPRGRKYRPAELKRHRDGTFRLVQAGRLAGTGDHSREERKPALHLALSVAGESSTSLSAAVGREEPKPNPDVFGGFLETKDKCFNEVANPRARTTERLEPARQKWAIARYHRFMHHVNMTSALRIGFELSNDGQAYAHGVRVDLSIPRSLNVMLPGDLPQTPPGVKDPAEPQQAGVATHGLCASSCEEYGVDEHPTENEQLQVYADKPTPPQWERHALAAEGVALSPDGANLTWNVGQPLVNQGNPMLLECLVRPPYEEHPPYQIDYTLHHEEGSEPITGTLELVVKLLTDEAAMERAWHEMVRDTGEERRA